MPDKKIIIEIQDYMQKHSLNTVQIAKKIKCPYVTLSRWINGHTTPSPAWKTLIRNRLKEKACK